MTLNYYVVFLLLVQNDFKLFNSGVLYNPVVRNNYCSPKTVQLLPIIGVKGTSSLLCASEPMIGGFFPINARESRASKTV